MNHQPRQSVPPVHAATGLTEPGHGVHLQPVIQASEARQRHLECILGSMRDALLEMHSDGMITNWSLNAEAMLGWTSVEIVGQLRLEYLLSDQHQKISENAIETCLRSDQPGAAVAINRPIEIELRHKDGHLISVEALFFLIPTAEENSLGVSLRDISECRSTEQALRLSQERYRAVIEHVSDGVVVTQSEQTVFANPSAAAILGISLADTLKHSLFHRIHPEDLTVARQQQKTSLAGGNNTGRIEVRILEPGGAIRWLSMGMTSIPWDGQTATLSFFSDITESRVLADAVRQSTERYRAVVEHVDEGMIVVKDERVAFANARAAEIAGMSLEDMQEIGFLHRIHPDDHELVLGRQRKRLAGEVVPSRYELRLLLPNGVIRWIGISVTVVPWDGEQATLTFFSDISQQRGLEEKLRDTLEERETILENSLVGIAFLTHDGGLRWSNQAMKKIFGLSQGSTAPTDWSALFPSRENYLHVLNDIADQTREGRSYQSDLQMRKLDGSLFWVTASGKDVSVLDKTQGSVWAVMDITARKELEAALARTSSEREAIFNSALVGIAFHVGRKIQWVNDKYEEMTGYSRKELVGYSSRLLYANDKAYEADGEKADEVLSRDGVYVDERPVIRRDGATLWVQLAGRCVSERNPAAGVIWTLLDITERRQAEDNIRAALIRERELNDLRSRFVSMTSHEFRTPLAAILSSAELLRDYSDRMPASEKLEVLGRIGTGVQRMAHMLDRVLLIGQADARMLEFHPEPIKLQTLCHAIVDEARGLHPEMHCVILTDFSPHVETGLFDAKLLRHILENLLANAIKYSPHGGKVIFSISKKGERTLFEIEDHGIGIPAEEMPHLFESFHRASNVGDIQGTGLGLAIVKKSVELHGGTIEVRSVLGVGTCFTICFDSCAMPS